MIYYFYCLQSHQIIINDIDNDESQRICEIEKTTTASKIYSYIYISPLLQITINNHIVTYTYCHAQMLATNITSSIICIVAKPAIINILFTIRKSGS